MKAPQILSGFRDLLPQDMIPRQRLFDTVKRIFESFGYEPVETPSLEYFSTLAGKEGGTSEKLMYDFSDHGDRHIGLIYELTISIARVLATYQDIPKPFKRYQIQRVWRADSPQKGRYREFYQCDFDSFGSTSMMADAEIVAIMSDSIGKLGFNDYSIHINHRKILNGIMEKAGLDKEKTVQAIIVIDKLDKIGKEGVAAELEKRGIGNVGLITDAISLEGSPKETMKELSSMIGDTDEGSVGLREMGELLTYSQILGSRVKLDTSLARGQTYYTGPIFEARVEKPNLGSLGGGGRYDDLIGIFSGTKVPAVGASLGLDRIAAVMVEAGMMGDSKTLVDVQVCHMGEGSAKVAMELAAKLRGHGFNTDFTITSQPLGKQLSYASRHGVKLAVIIAEDEVKNGTVTVKDLDTKEQLTISSEEIILFLKSKLNK